MIWSRLKNVCCPKCNRMLNQNWGRKGYECTNKECGFFITDEKFESVINSLYKVGQRVAELRDDLADAYERHNF